MKEVSKLEEQYTRGRVNHEELSKRINEVEKQGGCDDLNTLKSKKRQLTNHIDDLDRETNYFKHRSLKLRETKSRLFRLNFVKASLSVLIVFLMVLTWNMGNDEGIDAVAVNTISSIHSVQSDSTVKLKVKVLSLSNQNGSKRYVLKDDTGSLEASVSDEHTVKLLVGKEYIVSGYFLVDGDSKQFIISRVE